MKKFKTYINEKLIINKDTAPVHDIKTDINNDTLFTDEEIYMIRDFAQELPIIPVIITSKYLDLDLVGIKDDEKSINLYFSKDWKMSYTIPGISIQKITREVTQEDTKKTFYIARLIKNKKTIYVNHGDVLVWRPYTYKTIKECFDGILKVCKREDFFNSFKQEE